MRIFETLFLRKLVKHYYSFSNSEKLDAYYSIYMKILSNAYLIKSSKKFFKFLAKNPIALYDSCLFILYVVRCQIFKSISLDIKTKNEIDKKLILELINSFELFFKCTEIRSNSINFSRFEFYDEAVEKYKSLGQEDIVTAFDEFKILIKSDIINKSFREFSLSSPLYILNTFDETLQCDFECKQILKFAINEFDEEIENFIFYFLKGR